MAEPDLIGAMLYEPCRRKIISLRQTKGWSVAEMAEKAGIEADMLQRIEKGEEAATPEIVRKILDICGHFNF